MEPKRHTGHTTGTGGASSSMGEKRSQDSGKKHKSHTSGEAHGKFLNITCEDLSDLQKFLNGKEASLTKRTRLRQRQMIKSRTRTGKLRRPWIPSRSCLRGSSRTPWRTSNKHRGWWRSLHSKFIQTASITIVCPRIVTSPKTT